MPSTPHDRTAERRVGGTRADRELHLDGVGGEVAGRGAVRLAPAA